MVWEANGVRMRARKVSTAKPHGTPHSQKQCEKKTTIHPLKLQNLHPRYFKTFCFHLTIYSTAVSTMVQIHSNATYVNGDTLDLHHCNKAEFDPVLCFRGTACGIRYYSLKWGWIQPYVRTPVTSLEFLSCRHSMTYRITLIWIIIWIIVWGYLYFHGAAHCGDD